MYLLIFEDGSIVKSKSVGEEDFKASDDGILDIIDITSPEDPLIYFQDGWSEIS